MKKSCPLLFLLFVLTSLTAQPTIDSSWYNPSSKPYYAFVFDSLPDYNTFTKSGANITWDFSQLVSEPGGLIAPDSSVNLSETPFRNLFANANQATFNNQIFDSAYFFYSNTHIGYQWLGSVVFDGSGSDSGFLIIDSIPESLSYPPSYLDSYNEVAIYNSFSFVGNILTSDSDLLIDSIWMKYDGYGTLVTPAGTFNNVIRVFMYSATYDVTDGYYFDQENEDSSYGWISLDYPGTTLCQFDIQYGTLQGVYADFSFTGIHQIKPISSLNLWPQPANNKVNLKIENSDRDEAITVSIRDLSGREISHLNSQFAGSNKFITIDVSNLPAGLYIASLTTRDRMTSQKLSVVH